jgi:hypothetical protein
MRQDDAIRAFNDLHRLFPETILRTPPDLADEDGYVVEIRTEVLKVSELSDLLESVRRDHRTNKLTYDGHIEVRTVGEDVKHVTLWIVLDERLPDRAL